MKPLAVSLAVLAAILAFSLWTGCYVRGRTEAWSDQLASADKLAQQERWEEAEAGLQRAYADWDAIQTFLHTLMEHDALDEAEALFATAFAACDEQDGPDFHAAIAQLNTQLHLLAETQAISVKNIL